MGIALLRMGRLRRGELSRWSKMLDLSPRTLRKWRDQAESPPALGRPRHDGETWRAAVLPVARAWKSQGRSSGRRRVLRRLAEQGHAIPPTIVRELLGHMKARWRSVRAWQRRERRRGLVVAARDALWSLDATHLGRDERGKVEAVQVRDVATTRSMAPSVGGVARAEDVVAVLERARAERGALPLVVALDNGPAHRNERVCSYLAAERVVVLWNVPHTPQHNPWVENLNGELKIELDLLGELAVGGGDPSQGHGSLAQAGVPPTRSCLQVSVLRVTRVLNQRVRTSRGGLSAEQLDSQLARAEDLVSRDRFYEAACTAQRSAVLGIKNPRARRRAEREATLCTLEQ